MFSRRQFFTAAGSAALGTAALSHFGGRSQAGSEHPCRFVFIVEGNCVEPVTMLSAETRAALDKENRSAIGDKRWWYGDYRHDSPLEVTNAGLGTAKSLSSLTGEAGETSLQDRAMVVYGLSSKVTGGGHSTGSGCLSSSRPSGASPTGPSIDGLLAALPQIRRETPFEAIRLGIAPNDYSSRLNYTTCAIAASRPAPLIVDPTTAYVNLFGSVDENHRAAFEQRTALLDIALSRTELKLAQFKAGCEQRAKLEVYQDSLLQLHERQGILGTMKPAITAARDGLKAVDQLASTNPYQRLVSQFDMATAALIAGLSNVVVIGIGTGGAFNIEHPDYPMPDVENKRHDYHHLAQNAGNARQFQDILHNVSADYIAQAAAMARALDAVSESGGTMLDNTAIVYLSGNGEQHHSSASEFPTLILGGNNLGLRTDGRTVVYPGLSAGKSHRQLSSLYTTLAHAAGKELESFGNEGATLAAKGPLTEVLA